MALRIGTSGFDYKHWRGVFYPPSLPQSDRLAFYARHFDALELNVTFYRMPAADAFRRWAAIADQADAEGSAGGESAGDDSAPATGEPAHARPDKPFLFAVKASRYLTHVRRLRNPREPVEFLMERSILLGKHLGPLLLQLPPDMPIELDRLNDTLAAFGEVRVAVEPRNDSWFVPELEELLRERRAALCLADRHGPRTPMWRTADWTYVRFHEGGARPSPCYGDAALQGWVDRLRETWPEPEGAVFFNNDARGCAVENAARMRELLGEQNP